MTLTDNSTNTATPTTPHDDAAVEAPQHHPHPDRTRKVVSWLAVAVVLAGLALLVARLVGVDDEPTDSPAPAEITDAKDQPGYRLPTEAPAAARVTDAKDQPGYRLPTEAPATGADDRPAYPLQPIPV